MGLIGQMSPNSRNHPFLKQKTQHEEILGSHLIWFFRLKSLANRWFGTKLWLCGYYESVLTVLVCLCFITVAFSGNVSAQSGQLLSPIMIDTTPSGSFMFSRYTGVNGTPAAFNASRKYIFGSSRLSKSSSQAPQWCLVAKAIVPAGAPALTINEPCCNNGLSDSPSASSSETGRQGGTFHPSLTRNLLIWMAKSNDSELSNIITTLAFRLPCKDCKNFLAEKRSERGSNSFLSTRLFDSESAAAIHALAASLFNSADSMSEGGKQPSSPRTPKIKIIPSLFFNFSRLHPIGIRSFSLSGAILRIAKGHSLNTPIKTNPVETISPQPQIGIDEKMDIGIWIVAICTWVTVAALMIVALFRFFDLD